MNNQLAQPLHGYVQNELTEDTWEHIVAMQAAEIVDLRDQITALTNQLSAVRLDRDIAQQNTFTPEDAPEDAGILR